VICQQHRGESLPCWLCQLEERLPDESVGDRLAATAAYIERLADRYPLTGSVQGEVLHIADKIRELAAKLAA
jgi:hypothetical protein